MMGGMMGACGKGGGGKGDQWQCKDCGFSNKAHNDVCGGNGPMGCKAPKPQGRPMMKQQQAMMPMAMQMASSRQPMMGQMKGGGKTQGKPGSWECAGCGFQNRPQNEVCGGTGPAGCKAPKPSDWACPGCGFMNKPVNEVC